jgi:hypothetical protein
VDGFGPKVPQAVQDEVLRAPEGHRRGKLQPFAGPSDNEGTVLPRRHDGRQIRMEFLVSGVQGRSQIATVRAYRAALLSLADGRPRAVRRGRPAGDRARRNGRKVVRAAGA